jgi:hypothetical protein
MVFYIDVSVLFIWICIFFCVIFYYRLTLKRWFFNFVYRCNLDKYYILFFYIVKISNKLVNFLYYTYNYSYFLRGYNISTILVRFIALPFNLFSSFYAFFSVSLSLIKNIIIPLIISLFLILFFFDFFKLFSFKYLSIYLSIFFIFFWLFSCFNFFLKRYRFGKFTSSIQRFWKRSFVYFWLVEGFLFFLFFYFFLNSSCESVYFYDESSINLTFLLPLINTYISYTLILLLLFLLQYLIFNINTFSFLQTLLLLFLSLNIYIYIYLIETYQFYFVITSFAYNDLNFDEYENLWDLVDITSNIRIKKQYSLIILLLKYWHFLFIFCSFIFFVFKSYECRLISYQFLSFNIQNLFILFLLNLCLNFQWVKWVLWRFSYTSYFWLFSCYNNRILYDTIYECGYFLLNFFY